MDDPTILDTEKIARYIFENSKFKSDGVDHRIFLPRPNQDTSVFRVGGLSIEQVTALGTEHVQTEATRPVLGWAELAAARVRAIQLTLRPDEPPPLHALIGGWQSAPEDRRSAAMALAAASSAHKVAGRRP